MAQSYDSTQSMTVSMLSFTNFGGLQNVFNNYTEIMNDSTMTLTFLAHNQLVKYNEI